MYFSEHDIQAQLDRLLLDEIQETEHVYARCSITQGGVECYYHAMWYIRCPHCHRLTMPMCDHCKRPLVKHLRELGPFPIQCCHLVVVVEQVSFKKIPLPL